VVIVDTILSWKSGKIWELWPFITKNITFFMCTCYCLFFIDSRLLLTPLVFKTFFNDCVSILYHLLHLCTRHFTIKTIYRFHKLVFVYGIVRLFGKVTITKIDRLQQPLRLSTFIIQRKECFYLVRYPTESGCHNS
jgi:hypothetical protein